MNLLICFLSLFQISLTNVFTNEFVIETNDLEYESILGIDKDTYIINNCEYAYLIYQENKIYIENGEVKDWIIINDNIILLVSSNNYSGLIVFNKRTITKKEVELENIYPKDIYLNEEFIYISGTTKDNFDGIILLLDQSFKEVNKYYFKGDSYLSIDSIIKIDDYYYITIYKDALCNNSDFISTGNENEKCSIIAKLDLNFKIINAIYFYEGGTNEKIVNIVYSDNLIELILESSKKLFYYKLNLELEVINYYLMDEIKGMCFIIKHYKSTDGILILNQNSLKLITSSKVENIYTFINTDLIFDYKIIDGELIIYGAKDYTIYISGFNEYEIVNKEDAIFNKKYINETSINHFKVESWFEKLTFSLESTTPFLNKNINGKYKAVYSALRENNEKITIETDIIIKPYTNFINGGIYEKGKVLEFLGYAKLNGNGIYYGTSLDEEGEYEIEIIDANMESTFYKVLVVDEYYFDKKIEYIPSDITITYGNTSMLKYYIEDFDIDYISVDEKAYNDFYIDNGYLNIMFPHPGKSMVEVKKLDYIIYRKGDYFFKKEINKSFVITYLKKQPKYNLEKTINFDSLLTRYSIEDNNQCFVGLKISSFSDSIIYTSHTYETKNEEEVKILFLYTLGDGIIHEELLSEYLNTNNDKIEIYFKYEAETLKNITIKYNLNETIKKLNIDKVSYLNFINKDQPSFLKPMIVISLIIFFFNIVIILVYLILKKTLLKRI